MVERGAVASAWVFRAFLPPHPALSLGERENRSPLSGESNALGRAGVSALNRGAHGASGSDDRLNKDAGCQFPLPEGEGKGEGERGAANQNGRTNYASSTRPAPRLRVDNHIERRACRWSKGARSQAHWCFARSFPLTPPSPLGRGRIERRACRWSKGARSQAYRCFARFFPLTPPSPLGERENRWPLSGESNALGRAGVPALNRLARRAPGAFLRL